MNPKRMLGLSLLTLIFVLPTLAQSAGIEYGQAAELRGVTKIFVNTGANLSGHDLLVKEIHKRLPNVSVVTRPEDADVHLQYDSLKAQAQ